MSDPVLFADPPWRGGIGGIRMGLKPIANTHWLTPIAAEARREKHGLIAAQPERVIAAAPGSETGQRLALDAVRADLTDGTPASAGRLPDIAEAALLVNDDLCLMQRGDPPDAYRLIAACVCAPTYWSLIEKAGRSLGDIHATVPGLNAAIGAQMTRFFEKLPSTAIFERRNWFIHTSAKRFQPAPEEWPDDPPPAALFARAERQTLRRLAGDTVLFTIRVRIQAIPEIADYPDAAADLLRAFDALSEADRQRLGHAHYGARLTAFLSDIAARAA